MALMASGLSPQMVWAFCAAVWQSPLCHWSRPSTPCSLGLEWEWINQMVWERSANLMHFVSRSTAAEPRQDLRRYLQPRTCSRRCCRPVTWRAHWADLSSDPCSHLRDDHWSFLQFVYWESLCSLIVPLSWNHQRILFCFLLFTFHLIWPSPAGLCFQLPHDFYFTL